MHVLAIVVFIAWLMLLGRWIATAPPGEYFQTRYRLIDFCGALFYVGAPLFFVKYL